MPAQSIYALVIRNPPSLDKILKNTADRTRQGQVKLDKKAFRGILFGLRVGYDNQSVDEAFSFLCEYKVLHRDSESNGYIFDPIQAAGLLARSKREDPEPAMQAARERLAAKNAPRDEGIDINVATPSVKFQAPTEPLQESELEQKSQPAEPPPQRTTSSSEVAPSTNTSPVLEQIQQRMRDLETGVEKIKKVFVDLEALPSQSV